VRAWRLTAPGGELSFRDLTTYLPPEGEFTPGTNGVGVVEAAGAAGRAQPVRGPVRRVPARPPDAR
jgi:hypothetical protein